MTPFLDNLATRGQLKAEAFSQAEFDGLVSSAVKLLIDANKATLADESRFDLAYNAAHAFALAALRKKGYRSEYRYLVFQVLGACPSNRDSETMIHDGTFLRQIVVYTSRCTKQ